MLLTDRTNQGTLPADEQREGAMAQGMSRVFDDVSSADGSTDGASATSKPRGSTPTVVAPSRPACDVRGAAASRRPALGERSGFDGIIGRSPTLAAAIDAARKVAPTDTTVLLTGESGTGKEVLARAIHQASARADGPFIALNCAALPETLVESELFGHERGAFTGADRLKRGRFDLAAGGTLFLDEIGELTPAVQAKLLRVLQERQYERVGGTTTLQADFRLITATNRDLGRTVAEGLFRQDLYYRVAVFAIHLPTLRERGEDILLLADHFVRDLSAGMERQAPSFSSEAREALLAHPWPGNVRELQNAIERALIVADGKLISAAHLGIASGPPCAARTPVLKPPSTEETGAMLTIADQEKRLIVEVLQRTHGHQNRAAALLGLTRFQLYSRLKRYRIEIAKGLGAESGWTAIRC